MGDVRLMAVSAETLWRRIQIQPPLPAFAKARPSGRAFLLRLARPLKGKAEWTRE